MNLRKSETTFGTPSVHATAFVLGAHERNARLTRGWPRQKLAERAKISQSTLQQFQAGGAGVAMDT